MKRIVDSKEIAHLWAHQSQDSAKCSASMSFDGPNFYSYSTVIATIATNPSGEKAYLLSDAGYSVTTSRHQGLVRSSIPYGATVFTVPGVSRWGGDDFTDTLRILKSWAAGVEYQLQCAGEAKQPKKGRLMVEAAATVEGMREFAAFFAVEFDFPVIPASVEDLALWMNQKSEREAIAAEKKAAEEKKSAAILRKKTAPNRLAWLKGKSDSAYSWNQYHPVELRIVEGNVETSQGASFPVSHAKRGLALVESVIASKRPWQRNGHTCHLGNYEIDSIDVNGTVHAGCHVVTYKAIKRIREQILSA